MTEAVRVRVVKTNNKYILQVYNNSGFKMKVKNYGPYKTPEGAFRGAKRFIEFFNYNISQLDTEIKEDK